jgi:hypothetical protein
VDRPWPRNRSLDFVVKGAILCTINATTRLLLGLLALAGCSTIDSRIKEKPDAFASLDPATQAKTKQGIIELGFTTEAVYIALGQPSEIRNRHGKAGRETVWKYNSYYDRYEGSVHAGYRRFAYFDPQIRANRIYYEPVYAAVYSEQKDTYIRVIFEDGKITAIKQTKQ